MLGEVIGAAPGPSVVIVAAVHGNEPAGAQAAGAVLDALARRGCARGRVAARIGNRAALARGVRHQGHDLNRMWAGEVPADGPDAAEQRALAAWLTPRLGPEPAVLIDLHTTSAGGPPFALAIDTPGNRDLGAALPFPLVFGLLEAVPGTLAQWGATRGHRSIAIEAGRHDDPRAEATHGEALWRLLAALGCIDRQETPLAAELETAPTGAPGLLSVVHTHRVVAGDGFQMLPGFVSFQPIEAGTLLAHDHRGPIHAPVGGRLLMPLYQPGGREGFFIGREVADLNPPPGASGR